MTKIALLIQQTPALEDGNYLRLGNALRQLGHHVSCCFVDSLALNNGRLEANGFVIEQNLQKNAPFPPATLHQLGEQELIWILSVGDRQTFLDKIQMLYALPQHIQITNSLDAIMHLKSKYFWASHGDLFTHPDTYASTNSSDLIRIVTVEGGKWIAKPPAGSLGRDVFLIEAHDPNMRAIIQHLCGPDDSQYTLLQRYVAEIENGEKRILLAGGTIIGQYQRFAERDHRTNINQGARYQHCELSDVEQAYCINLAQFLATKGAHFVGIDLVFPYLIETNVVNPGGLLTLSELNGQDHSKQIAQSVLEAIAASS